MTCSSSQGWKLQVGWTQLMAATTLPREAPRGWEWGAHTLTTAQPCAIYRAAISTSPFKPHS